MRPGLFILVLALATSPVVAMADEPSFGPAYGPMNDPPAPASTPAANAKWYGLPILVSDLASAALSSLATWGLTAGPARSTPNNPAEPVLVLGGLGYLITSPVVHALNGHGWRAVGSVALRLFLPAAGFVIGGLAATCPPPPAVVPSGIEYCDG